MRTNVPIYRAKKIDSDEWVEGFYVDTVDFLTKTLKNTNGYITKNGSFHIVDISTLAIHFPDMLDSQGNKIFASLQEDGKGGDIIESEFKHKCVVKYREYFLYADNEEKHINCFGFKNSKVIGIQE